ncbi:MAG: tetratricopeptide repeat protein, partial [Anaerolineae bacterium]
QARQLGLPWRMLWYQFGPFAAYSEVGRHAEVLALADATLRTTTDVEELHYWRGRALAALGDPEGARQAFARAVALNPGYAAAVAALKP